MRIHHLAGQPLNEPVGNLKDASAAVSEACLWCQALLLDWCNSQLELDLDIVVDLSDKLFLYFCSYRS